MIHGRIPWNTGYAFNLLQSKQLNAPSVGAGRLKSASNKVRFSIKTWVLSQSQRRWFPLFYFHSTHGFDMEAKTKATCPRLPNGFQTSRSWTVPNYPDMYPWYPIIWELSATSAALSCRIHQFHCCRAAFLIRWTLGLLPPQLVKSHPSTSHIIPTTYWRNGPYGPTQISSLFLA